MDKFSLLSKLNAKQAENARPKPKQKLTEGIQYEEYDIEMFDGKTKTVYVPSRRTEIFESEMMKTEVLTETTVRGILRKCNGVTSII